MKLGISGVLPHDPAALTREALERVRALGFHAVALPFGAATADINVAIADRIRGLLEAAEVRPVELGHYQTSLVSPDAGDRARSIRAVQQACQVAARIGKPPVIIGSGSLNPKGQFLPHAENHDMAVRERLIQALREAVKGAEDTGVVLGLEPHTVTALKDAATVRAIIDEVSSPALRVHMDPVNWVTFETVYATGALLERIFDTLPSGYILGLHAKGVQIEDRLIIHMNETYAGAPDDLLDYPTYLRRAAAYGAGVDLVIEHTPMEFIPTARDYIRRIAEEVGVLVEP